MWQNKMLRKPSFVNNLSKKIQTKVNSWIPDKVNRAITVTIKQMVRAILFSAQHITAQPLQNTSLELREEMVRKKIDIYRKLQQWKAELQEPAAYFLALLTFLFY